MAHNAKFGIALDVGTSNLDGLLLDLSGPKAVSRKGIINSQVLFGGDVISRLNFAISKESGLESLNREIIKNIDELIRGLVLEAGADAVEVERILCVGNSAMHHLVLSIPPEGLARSPFRPSHVNRVFRGKAKELGLGICPEADFEFMPNLGGFVGSDALAVIIATGIYRSESTVLAIDIGTNGEVILGNRDRIFVTSTSAGPAFEGWHISCGMQAVEGAIESLEIKSGELSYTTIGGTPPKGLCGSGLIDLAAALLDTGSLDRTGRLADEKFRVAVDINITQEDIREIQLAKAAIKSAVNILRKKSGRGAVEKVYLTGRFGSRMSKANAKAIGILPEDVDSGKVEIVKDGALGGAASILASKDLEKAALGLYNRITHVELHKEKGFQDEFVNAMGF